MLAVKERRQGDCPASLRLCLPSALLLGISYSDEDEFSQRRSPLGLFPCVAGDFQSYRLVISWSVFHWVEFSRRLGCANIPAALSSPLFAVLCHHQSQLGEHSVGGALRLLEDFLRRGRWEMGAKLFHVLRLRGIWGQTRSLLALGLARGQEAGRAGGPSTPPLRQPGVNLTCSPAGNSLFDAGGHCQTHTPRNQRQNQCWEHPFQLRAAR